MSPGTSLLCHRRPDRALRMGSWTSPHCARCTAFYPALLAALAVPLLVPLPAPSLDALLLGYVAAVVPLALDGATQALGWRRSTPALRVATGLLAGSAVGLTLALLLLGNVAGG